MDKYRIALAIILSTIVIVGYPTLLHYLSPPPPVRPPAPITLTPNDLAHNPPAQAPVGPSPDQPARGQSQTSPRSQAAAQSPVGSTTAAPEREITVNTPYWTAKFSSHGAVVKSWVLKAEKLPDGSTRSMVGADGKTLELVPQSLPEGTAPPLSLTVPQQPALNATLGNSNYQVEGIDPSVSEIDLKPSESKTVSFAYSAGGVVARKEISFTGDSLIFGLKASVSQNGSNQPAELAIGPRFGDQSDRQVGTYSVPPQIVAQQISGHIDRSIASRIASKTFKITALDEAARTIQIDGVFPSDVPSIQALASDGKTSLGYAAIVKSESGGKTLVLDRIPPGAAVGLKISIGDEIRYNNYIWAGAADHYFAMIAVPSAPSAQIDLRTENKKPGSDVPLDYPSVSILLPSDGGLRIFVGPKDRHILGETGTELSVDLDGLIDYGMFSVVIKPLSPLIAAGLTLGAKIFRNYGWSIVFMTILLNLLLSPLRFHSSRKMKAAAKHQPRLKELQERMKQLKKNEKRNEREITDLQREQMDLMKEANPLGGCLPMLLQMPIFWAFYIFLEVSLDVRHQPWILWVKDLSVPDPLRILPIVMCVSMIGSSMLQPQPAATDPSMKMQRNLTVWVMPIFLTWLFFFSAPSGLVLYWMVSNLAGVALQFGINKFTTEAKAEDDAADGKKGAKTGAKQARDSRRSKVREKEIVGGVK